MSRHYERNEESHVDAERSNLVKSTLLISSSLALYFRRSFGKLKMIRSRHSERSEESHGDAKKYDYGNQLQL